MDFDKFCGFSSVFGLILSAIGLCKTDSSLIVALLLGTLIIFVLLGVYSIWHYDKAQKYLDCENVTLSMRSPYRIYVMEGAELRVIGGRIENADILVKKVLLLVLQMVRRCICVQAEEK